MFFEVLNIFAEMVNQRRAVFDPSFPIYSCSQLGKCYLRRLGMHPGSRLLQTAKYVCISAEKSQIPLDRTLEMIQVKHNTGEWWRRASCFAYKTLSRKTESTMIEEIGKGICKGLNFKLSA